MALNGSRNVASTPRKLHRSLSSNSLLSTMSKEELKTIVEQARNREEDLQLAAKLGMELQREVEDKTEKLREMETLLNQLQVESSKPAETKVNSTPSTVYKAETKESDGNDEDEDDDSEIEKETDDLIQFFRNHLITSLHQTELAEASPSPLQVGRSISAEKSISSPISTPTSATFRSMVFPTTTPKQRNSFIMKKRLTEEQIKALTPHQLFVEYKRNVRNSLRQLQEKVGTKEEEISKMREQLLAMGSKSEDIQHKKLIIQRLQDELEQTQLRAAQREIELKAEMRRLVALSTTATNSTPSSTSKSSSNSSQQTGRKRGASVNFSEVSSDSEQEGESESKETQVQQSKKKTREQLHLTLNLPQIYAHNQTNGEDGTMSPPVLSPSLTRHIYRLPSTSSSTTATSAVSSSSSTVSSSSATKSTRVSLDYPIVIQQDTPENGTNYKKSRRHHDSMEEQLRPLIKGGGIHEGEAGCWDKFQGWNLYTFDIITTSNFLSDWWLWFYRLIATVAVLGVIAFHAGHRIESGDQWWLWLTYLTNWNQLLVACYFSFALIYSSQRDDPGESSTDKPLSESFGRRLTFVLFELAFATTITVVVMFWSVIFNPSDNGVNLALDALTHGLILFWILTELFANRITFPWTHIIWELVIVGAYLIFIYVYTVNYKTVYDMVTFKDSKSTEVVVGAIVLSLGGFALGYALTQIRDYCCGHGDRPEKQRHHMGVYQPPTLTENQRLTVADLRAQSTYGDLPKRDDTDEF